MDLFYRVEFSNLVEHSTGRKVIWPEAWFDADRICMENPKYGLVLYVDPVGAELRHATMLEF